VSPGHTCSRKRIRKRRTFSAPSQPVAYVPTRPACHMPTENGVGNPAALANSSSWWIGFMSPEAPW
jgi:hypothetical protein